MKDRTRVLLSAAGLVLAAMVLYIPSFSAGFTWDDDSFLTENRLIHAPDGLRRFWFSADAPDYFPLTSSCLWVEYRIFGMNAAGYHAVNILLHGLSGVLLWRVFAALGLPGAWWGALLFVCHPLNVTSVSWITERKNTLCMVFYALSALLFLKHRDKPTEGRLYAGSLLAFLLSLLAKTASAMLPVSLWVLLAWRREKVDRIARLRLIPFFAISAVLGLVTVWFQSHRAIADEVVRTDGFLSRLCVAGIALWSYLAHALMPLELRFIYPRWAVDPGNPAAYLPLVALGSVFLALWRLRHWSPARAMFFAGLYYVLTLLPVLGFVNIYFMRYSYAADHWQYFALPGMTALGAAAIASTARIRPALPPVLFSVLVAGLCVLSWNRQGIFRDEEALWQSVLGKEPAAWVAHANLGLLAERRGDLDAAVESYQRALRERLEDSGTLHNLAVVRIKQGAFDDAEQLLRKALKRTTRPDTVYVTLGVLRERQQRWADADVAYLQALEVEPHNVDALCGAGVLRMQAKREREALDFFHRALAIDSSNVPAHHNVGIILYGQQQRTAAREEFEAVLRLAPDNAEAHNALGVLLFESGAVSEAVVHFEAAVRLRPEFSDARENLLRVRAVMP